MRLDRERQAELEPMRTETCKEALQKLGYSVETIGSTTLKFLHKGSEVTFFPYSGWHTGKSIQDGRGFQKLLKQLKK